uniref:Putative secreted peptide n=1 Tax=Anopheles braziliensis TaxID=58242 RepID=A0A2M3ZSC2_9DIPT
MLWFNYHLQLCLAFVILLRRHTFSSLRPMSIRCVLQLKSATKCARFIDLLYSEPLSKLIRAWLFIMTDRRSPRKKAAIWWDRDGWR